MQQCTQSCSQIANEEAQTKNAYMLFFNKVQHDENAGSSEGSLRASDGDVKTIDIRRQSVSLPHLWPHVVQLDDIEGRPTLSRLVSDDAKWSGASMIRLQKHRPWPCDLAE